MAHFAKISETNEVLQVLTLADSDMLYYEISPDKSEGRPDELTGQQYLQMHNNWPAELWIQTSYNTINNTHRSGDNSKAFRGNYAAIGFFWDSTNQIFWPNKQFASWVKDLTSACWKAPLEKPSLTDEQIETNNSGLRYLYQWDETAYQNDNSTGWVLEDRLA